MDRKTARMLHREAKAAWRTFEKAVEDERQAGKLTRARAIHYHCLDCMGYMPASVAKCTNTKCPLWEYRTGKYTPLGEKAVEGDS